MTGDDKNPDSGPRNTQVLARFHGVDWIGLELSGVELDPDIRKPSFALNHG